MFCILTVLLVTLLKLLINLNTFFFFGQYFQIFYIIISSVNKTSFIYFFSIIYTVFPLSGVTALASNFQYNIEKECWEGPSLPCSQSYWERFMFLINKYDVRSRVFVHILNKLRKLLFISNLLTIFIINGCWILSKVFSASIDMLMWCFCLYPVDMMDYINWLLNDKLVLHT